MSLFQNEMTPTNETNYNGMGKKEMIMLLQSQKSDIDALNRKLSRTDELINENKLLTEQTASLSEENEALKKKIAELEKKLSAKELTQTGAGSVRSTDEIFRHFTDMVEAVQKSAGDYLERIKAIHDDMSNEYNEYEASARQRADTIVKNAVEEADTIKQNARSEANDIWDSLQAHITGYISEKKQ